MYKNMNILDINNIIFTVLGHRLSYAEFLGTVFGLTSVVYATRQNILTWPAYMIQTFFFFSIFYQIQLYSDMFLQIYFLGVAIVGWVTWSKEKPTEQPIHTLLLKHRLILIVFIIVSSTLLGFLVKDLHIYFPSIFKKQASYPFIDTFVTILSICASILIARRFIETWFLWFVVDIISVILYIKKGVLFISLEYFIFLILGMYGLYSWKQALKIQKTN